MTTPTAEEFRNVIADELEALAKRVREPTTYIEQTERSGTFSISRDNEIMSGPRVSTFTVRVQGGMTATLTLVGDGLT